MVVVARSAGSHAACRCSEQQTLQHQHVLSASVVTRTNAAEALTDLGKVLHVCREHTRTKLIDDPAAATSRQMGCSLDRELALVLIF